MLKLNYKIRNGGLCMGKIKKITSLFCVAAMAASLNVQISAENSLYSEIFSYTTGSSASLGTLETEGSVTFEQVDGAHGTSIKLTGDSDSLGNRKNTGVYFFSEECAQPEATLISLDMYMESAVKSYFQVYNAPTSSKSNANVAFTAVRLNQARNIYYAPDLAKGGESMYQIPVEENTWYHIDMWFDYETGNAHYYLDGNLLAEIEMPSSLTNISGFRYFLPKDGVYEAVQYLDNVKMYNFTKHSKNISVPGVAIPDEMIQEIAIKPNNSLNNLGYIYFSKVVPINVSFKNISAEKSNYKIEYAAYNEQNEIAASNSVEIELKSDEWTSKILPLTVDKFGLYTMQINVLKDTEIISSYNQEFSVANHPTDGALNEYMGLNDHTYSQNHGSLEFSRKMKLLADAGFSSVRESMLWQTIEPQKDNLQTPEGLTDYINLLDENNMKSYSILMGKPSFITNNPALTDDEYAEWKDYCEYVASNTSGVSPYFEVWNEYNVPAFNLSGGTPADYAKLLKATYEGVKAGNPNAKVCAFAVANVGETEGYDYSSLEWMQAVLEELKLLGDGKYFDIASIHDYTHVAPESTNKLRPWLIGKTRTLLDSFGYTDASIVVSEMGWCVNDELLQAQYMVRYAVVSQDNPNNGVDNNLDSIYWYVSQEKEKTGDSSTENLFGIIRTWDVAPASPHTPYGAKPAFLALSNYNAFLANADLVWKCATSSSSDYNYKYLDRDGKIVYVVWTTKSSSAIEVNLDKAEDVQNAHVFDMYGNEVEFVSAGNKSVTVAASKSPVYVKVDPEYNPDTDVSLNVNFNTGEVTLTGVIDELDSRVGVNVSKDGAENGIIYVGQTKTDANGNYSVNFKASNAVGDYKIKLGFDTKYKIFDLSFKTKLPELNVFNIQGIKVSDMAGLNAGDKLSVKLNNLSENINDKAVKVITAQYLGNKMVKSDVADIEKGKSTFQTEVSVAETAVDCIRVFYWDMSGLYPIIGKYEIN